MDLKKANNKLEKTQNTIEYYLSEKESKLAVVMPRSTDTTKINANGGTRVDKFLLYAELIENVDYDNILDELYKEKNRLINFIDKELKRLNKYDEVLKLIINFKETGIYDPKDCKFKILTWEQISKKVHYSKTFCRNAYRKYKKERMAIYENK